MRETDSACPTAMRTGAVGATGLKYPADQKCERPGLVGTGVQAWYLLLLSTRVRDFKEISIHDIDAGRASGFASRFRKLTGRKIRVGRFHYPLIPFDPLREGFIIR